MGTLTISLAVAVVLLLGFILWRERRSSALSRGISFSLSDGSKYRVTTDASPILMAGSKMSPRMKLTLSVTFAALAFALAAAAICGYTAVEVAA